VITIGFFRDLQEAWRGESDSAGAVATVATSTLDGSATLRGTGDFDVNAVGESNYVPALLKVAGVRRSETDAEIELRTLVTLVPEPDNAYDPNAVAIVGEAGRKLAYLCREDAGECCGALSTWPAPATCWAEIGGRHRDGRWIIGVRLDLDFEQF
jgi:hypothetical protein